MENINKLKLLTPIYGPHLRDHSSTQRIMQEVCLALLPAGIAGVIIFGWSALMLICVSVATCVLSEFVWEKLTKRTVTIGDWSAVVTGLLLAYNLPANAPWWLAVVGGVIAIVLVKQMFGGIGTASTDANVQYMGRIDKESDDAILNGNTDLSGAVTTDGQAAGSAN